MKEQRFAADLLNWFAQAAREMPWRESKDPYRIWISEIMLQQTQVKTVIPYFERFIQAFPDIKALAEAPLDQVLKLWEGLGYYSRARNLHKGAAYILQHHQGIMPNTLVDLLKVPGIGPYSAGAILSIAHDIREPAVDGNVIRVFSRLDAILTAFDTQAARRALEQRVKTLIPEQAGDFNQALMELGALICSPQKPQCTVCPVQNHCQAYTEGNPEIYPVKVKKTTVKNVKLAIAMICNAKGEYLIQKQDESGLFKGMWCFPWFELAEQTGLQTPTSWPVQRELTQHVGTVSHTLSHRQLHMQIYLCQKTTQSINLADDWAWLDLTAKSEFAMPVAHQKVANYLQEHPLLFGLVD